MIPPKNNVGNYTADSVYQRNLNNLLTSFTAAPTPTTTPGFYNFSSGQNPDRVNGIGFCRGNVRTEDCRACMRDAARQILDDCPYQKAAVGFYDFCMIRYSDRFIFGVLDSDPVTFYIRNGQNTANPIRFNATVDTLLTRLRKVAVSSPPVKNFATGMERQGVFVTVYGLVQCSPDLSGHLCDECLVGAIGQIPRFSGGRVGGRVINPNCNLRFETSQFYADSEVPPTTLVPLSPSIPRTSPSLEEIDYVSMFAGNDGSKNMSQIVAIVVPIVGILILVSILFLFCYGRNLTRLRITMKRSSQNDMTLNEVSNDEGLQLDFDTIKVATNNFASGRKLGEGGFGAVYKGTLSNGEDVAVKRLAKGSRQGDLEFKNEVNLVARLKHRNLVRLLGFCLEGRERLLMYEYMPNASLDHFLFNKDKQVNLDWERRYKIIVGITRGLIYLHQDSRLRVIHHDLKASNILLDADTNPKISDFGMARLFDIDETHRNTSRIVGTYGYMAPEYAMHGLFLVKSDVFSFGVMILEIVSGQNCYSFHHGSSKVDLLSYAWTNWKDESYTNFIDPSLGNVSRNELERCIHIGLLCVQENPNDRPTMASVALMMTNGSMSLQVPSKPAFFTQDNTDTVEFVEGASSACTDSSKPDVSITELYPR
ncbi:Cysteine-rich receptor-like protein kinase 10 [Linum perenne]